MLLCRTMDGREYIRSSHIYPVIRESSELPRAIRIIKNPVHHRYDCVAGVDAAAVAV